MALARRQQHRWGQDRRPRPAAAARWRHQSVSRLQEDGWHREEDKRGLQPFVRVWARHLSGINTCFGLSALIILCHPWRSSRELCSHQDSGDDAMDAGKQLSLKAKKESTQQMAAPAQGSLSVKQLDAMAAARTKQHGAASSAQAEASDDDTEDGDPQVPRKVRALAVPLRRRRYLMQPMQSPPQPGVSHTGIAPPLLSFQPLPRVGIVAQTGQNQGRPLARRRSGGQHQLAERRQTQAGSRRRRR